MCNVLGVSESGYYRSLKEKQVLKKSELLLVKIKEIIAEHPDNENYGVQRVHMALLLEGNEVSYSTVYRIMKENKLVKKAKRHPNGITKEDMAAQKSENLINNGANFWYMSSLCFTHIPKIYFVSFQTVLLLTTPLILLYKYLIKGTNYIRINETTLMILSGTAMGRTFTR